MTFKLLPKKTQTTNLQEKIAWKQNTEAACCGSNQKGRTNTLLLYFQIKLPEMVTNPLDVHFF